MIDFIRAYFVTIIIEYAVLYLLLKKQQDRQIDASICGPQNEYFVLSDSKLITRNAIIASSLTLPFVWFVFPLLSFGTWNFGLDPWIVQTTLAELFAFFVEAVVYRFLFNGISWKDAILASFLCNLTSFIVGLIII